jgi:hypothetical protein
MESRYSENIRCFAQSTSTSAARAMLYFAGRKLSARKPISSPQMLTAYGEERASIPQIFSSPLFRSRMIVVGSENGDEDENEVRLKVYTMNEMGLTTCV